MVGVLLRKLEARVPTLKLEGVFGSWVLGFGALTRPCASILDMWGLKESYRVAVSQDTPIKRSCVLCCALPPPPPPSRRP